MLHTLLFVTGSISIGYILWFLLYYRDNHCIVSVKHGLINTVDYLILLGVVGFVLSLF